MLIYKLKEINFFKLHDRIYKAIPNQAWWINDKYQERYSKGCCFMDNCFWSAFPAGLFQLF